MKTVHVRIEGRVQGVYFRDYTRREALKLGIDGWVRNASDGSVEAVVSGPEKAVEAMLDWFQTGSPHAIVRAVKVREISLPETFSSFEIRH
jgi:acylphosphatase